MDNEKMAEAISFYRRYPDKFFEMYYPEYRLYEWQRVLVRALAKSETACLLMCRGRYLR